MATYQLVGSQDPAGRIDRVEVESPTEENPEGKVLELHGAPQELSDDQYSKLSRFVRLQPVKAEEQADPQYVDQPGVKLESLSTDVPPDPGTAPDVGALDKEGLQAELARVQAEGHLQDVDPKANKADLQDSLRKYHGQEA
jgi:hypothetical protein